jgi:hypothetical protein
MADVNNLIKSAAEMEQFANDLLEKSENLKSEEVSKPNGDTASEKDEEEEESKDKVEKSIDMPKQTGEPDMSENTAKADAKEANGDLSDAAEKSSDKDLSKGEEAEELGEFDPNTNEDISKAIEISDFLSALTGEITGYVNGLSDNINKSLGTNDVIMKSFAKSFQAIAQSQQAVVQATSNVTNLVKSISDKVDEMNGRMSEMEQTPVVRKSVSNTKVLDRDFQKSIGVEKTDTVLSKSQKASILTDLILKGEASTMDMLNLESGATLDPSIEAKIQAKANNR